MQTQLAQQGAVGAGKKYRDDEEYNNTRKAANIMSDKRVVRGNTYAALVVPEEDPNEIAKMREAQRRRIDRANKPSYGAGQDMAPVPGRHHMDVQTDTYLEELTERTMEFEAETQTDFLLDRPQEPLFMPAKIGVDAGTQIEDGELFNFDVEVEPILEVLVGKTLERGMMECCEEEELAAMRRHQNHFQQLREQELIEVQRMESAEQRRSDEKNRRKEQASAQKAFDDAVMRKILSRNISRSYLGGLQERCFIELQDAGMFHNPNLTAVESLFMPWIFRSVEEKINNCKRNEQIANHLLRSAISDSTSSHKEALSALQAKQDEIDAAEGKVRAEVEEGNKIAEAEAKRIKEEQARLAASENEEYIADFTVTEYAVDDEGAATLTLEDGSTDCQVPADLVEGLQARLAFNAENPDNAVPVVATVNKTTKALTALVGEMPTVPEAPAEEPTEDA